MLAHVSGNWNNGANYGVSILNANNSSGNANVNLGGRTLIRENHGNTMHSIFLTAVVKIKPTRAGLSRLILETP